MTDGYKRAPITEAVFALQFRETIKLRELERIGDRLKRRYPKVDERINVEFRIAGGKGDLRQEKSGFQLGSANAVDMVILDGNSLTTSRLAPYDSWEGLLRRARENFEDLLHVSRPVVSRLGARFINRIDIPNREVLGEDPGKFFNGMVHLPPGLVSSAISLHWQATVFEAETGVQANVAFATQHPSPLLDHSSFNIDIDVYQHDSIPLRHEDMWSLAAKLRAAKNNLFEGLITDEVRKLIS